MVNSDDDQITSTENSSTPLKRQDYGDANLNCSSAKGMKEVCESTERLKSEFMEQMEIKLSAVINDVLQTVQKADVVDRYRKITESPSSSLAPKTKDGRSRSRKLSVTGKLPEKVFISRPSPLTELLQVTHFKTIHHIFIATLILIMLHTVILDLVEQKKVDLGLVRLMWAFGNPQMTLTILLGLEFCGLVVLYPSFHFWSRMHHRITPGLTKMIDYMAAVCFLSLVTGMICVPAVIMWNNPLPPASGATITMEQCRLLMKIYAFVRSNVPRVLENRSNSPKRSSFSAQEKLNEHKFSPKAHKNSDSPSFKENENNQKDEGDASRCSTSSSFLIRKRQTRESDSFNASFHEATFKDRRVSDSESISSSDEKVTGLSYSKYLYFYVAPTLIYKDSYPRTSYVRWDYVCWNFSQVLGCIIYANFILSRYSSFYFINFGHPDHPMTVLQFCNAVFSMMLPGCLSLVLGFYLLLHSWHNAFAEMLCFGDRLFYKDWWNSSSFHSYYKTWNILVHDWLYTYIFKDAWEMGLAKYNKALPTILVFVISSLFHEYVLSFTFNFFFPVLLTLFGGFGLALTFLRYSDNSAIGNIFMWFGLISGCGILVSTYTMEFYARLNCPAQQNDSFSDFFTPRFWTCNAIVWK